MKLWSFALCNWKPPRVTSDIHSNLNSTMARCLCLECEAFGRSGPLDGCCNPGHSRNLRPQTQFCLDGVYATMADDAKAIALSREGLYELAWSKPLSELAKDFGVSNVGLAKRCRRLGIPVPGRGYLAGVRRWRTKRRYAGTTLFTSGRQ